MFFFYFDTENIKIELGTSPKENDLAIVSIDQYGNLGELNRFVLREYGYSEHILKELNLEKGYDLFQLNHKPILFIVTINDVLISNNINLTKFNLETNLSKAIDAYFDLFRGRSIWIPLMGTGSGGLTMNESFDTIINVLKIKILKIEDNNCTFNISIPDNDEGLKLFNNIKENNNSVEEDTISESNAKNIITDSNARFYLVGTIWDNEEQSERFYKEGIWENGYENGEYFDLINRVKENDILIHKSSFSKRNGKSVLRIKAFGIVKYVHNDGKKLDVDWIIKLNEKLDIDGLGFYRDTISSVNIKDLIKIFTAFSSQDFEELYYTFVHKKKNLSNIDLPSSTKLAGLIADVESGEDYLDIKKDVNAFARVIAAKSFEPPLAIALFGKWGSGKSFFMRKLKDSIQSLSMINPEKQFCEGVAHVHFNAWSYMDANLWASIVTRIFEGLDEYINGLKLPEKEKKEIEQQLFQKLTLSKEEHKELEEQKFQIKKRIQELKTHKKNTNDELKSKIASIKNNSIKEIIDKVDEEFKVQEQINKTLNENPTFVESFDKFEKIVPKQYWDNPTVFYNEIMSGYAFIKSLFIRKNWKTNLCWLLVFIILLTLVPPITYLINLLISWEDFTLTNKELASITIFGTFFTRGIDTYLKLKKQIAPFWNLKEKYEKEKEAAIFKFKQEEKALKLEIKQKKDEIIQVNNELNTHQQLQANLEFKLKNALSTHALYTFIEKRANSDDYKKHLGIVSLIRKDFEILSGLLTDHHTELVSNKDSNEFKKLFDGKKSLERIILYIDDLDRCPEERVVEVLEAVNLLMAFPLFVVVVGVDPRWVKTALQKKYENQFNQVHENEEAISPTNYLEKIFQVPFHLKDAGDTSIKNMIKTLVQTKPNIYKVLNKESTLEKTADIKSDIEINDKRYKLEKNSEILNQTISINELFDKETIEALDITEKECELMQDMSEIIGNNPRVIKRFINIYRIVKTHEDFGFSNEETKDHENGLILLILALSMGNFKELMKSFDEFINRKFSKGNENLRSYLLSEDIDEIHKNLDGYHIKRQDICFLLDQKNPEILNQPFSTIFEHYQFIKRFTFKNI